MTRHRAFFGGAALLFATQALPSYTMICALHGDVSSDPVMSSSEITFTFQVDRATDAEDPTLGRGEADCHLLLGAKLHVTLSVDGGSQVADIANGARLVLRRIDFDVVATDGGVYRNTSYERIH